MSVENNATIIGRLGQDPEQYTFEDGNKVVNFSVATSKRYTRKSDGAKIDKTEWHRVVVWNGLADIVMNYTRKGSQVALSGELRTRTWEKDGNKGSVTEILGESIKLLDPKGDAPSSEVRTTTEAPEKVAEGDDDLPF